MGRRDALVKTFSGGMQATGDCRGLLHTPKVLFLDDRRWADPQP
jgi:ABC-type multidrug transport system ATPase subunit